MTDQSKVEFELDTGEVIEVRHCGSYVQITMRRGGSAPVSLAIIASNGNQYDIGPVAHFITSNDPPKI